MWDDSVASGAALADAIDTGKAGARNGTCGVERNDWEGTTGSSGLLDASRAAGGALIRAAVNGARNGVAEVDAMRGALNFD